MYTEKEIRGGAGGCGHNDARQFEFKQTEATLPCKCDDRHNVKKEKQKQKSKNKRNEMKRK